VSKLMFESVLSGVCTPAEILEAAYDDPQGYRYWDLWLFEPLQIYQFAELLALHDAATDGARVLDRYLFQIFERLRAAAEASEAWFIGDTSVLITETWSSLALRNSALAVRPREAIAWMWQNPNARHLLPRTPSQIAGSMGCANSPAPATALPVADSVISTGAQGRMRDPSDSEAPLESRAEAQGNPLQAGRATAAHIRRRGRKAFKLEQTKEKMKRDLLEGRKTADELSAMLEKDLVFSYGVSRDTARKARDVVLSAFVANCNFDT
jgi:hypothetical protein